MKNIAVMLFAAASIALAQTPPPTPAQQVDALYKSGLAAEKVGDVDTARNAYNKVLKLDPNHANSRYRLNQLKIDAPQLQQKRRELTFGAVQIPAYQLDDATLQEALEALNILVTRESKGSVTPNFVIQDPNKKLAAGKITLSLKNLPASAVMKYLMEQARAKARFDEHAIVIEPIA